MSNTKRLYRSQNQRMISGVCGGIAEYFNLDPTIVRVAFVLAALLWGGGVVAYILLWVVIPENPNKSDTPSRGQS